MKNDFVYFAVDFCFVVFLFFQNFKFNSCNRKFLFLILEFSIFPFHVFLFRFVSIVDCSAWKAF